jgi:hypothetical protein
MINLLNNTLVVLVALTMLIACQGQQSSEQDTGTDPQMSPEQMEALAMQRGKEIAMASQKTLGANLKGAIQRGGIQEAFTFCNVQAMPITDSLSRAYDASVKRATLWVRNPKDEPTETERIILEEYQAMMQAGETPEPRVINLNEDYVLYTQPIAIGNGLCLNCHGEVGTQIQEETYALIQERYPDDQATGHKMGDLRGIWSIRFDKSSLKQEEVMGMLQ